MIAALRSRAGLARSLLIYRARPWRIARLAASTATSSPRATSPSTSAPTSATAPAPSSPPAPASWRSSRRRSSTPSSPATCRPRSPSSARPPAPPPAGAPSRSPASTPPSPRSPLASPRAWPPTPGFARVRWDAAEPVEITTLDALVATHGLPRFVKIDVEGFEPDVLAGLTAAPPWVAFEVLPAAPDAALACVARLASLGPYAFSLVPGETAAFANDWQPAPAFTTTLAAFARGARSGDVYARLPTA